MDRYKKFLGIIIFLIAVVCMFSFSATAVVGPQHTAWNDKKLELEQVTEELTKKQQAKANIVRKLKKLKDSVMSSQKRIYSPTEDNIENDTLFFTLYSDVIEMVRANTIKIKSIDYQYSPKGDIFVAQGDAYFVCDVNMEVVSNYKNLGKLIENLYQYPYYIKINNIEVVPYQKDKKILLSTISLRLYAHTSPENIMSDEELKAASADTIEGATSPLPQE